LLDADFYFFEKTGLVEHLSMNRSNGLVAMLNQIKEYAKTFANG
jgi:cysteine desulfuration protein SufE